MLNWLKRFGSTKAAASSPRDPPGTSQEDPNVTHNRDLEDQLRKLSEEKSWVEVARLTGLLVESGTLDGFVYRYYGLAMLHMDDTSLALEALERALDIEPTDAEVHVARSIAYDRLGDKEAAFDAGSLALHYSPNSARICKHYGFLCKRIGRSEEALDYFTKAIDLDPDLGEAYLALAQELHEGKNFQGAVSAYQRAVELGQSSFEVLNNLGHALISLEHYADAIPPLVKAVEMNPHASVTRINLGCAYRHVGNDSSAIEQFEAVLRLQPNNFEAKWYQSHVWLAAGEWEKGWEQYECRFPSEAALNRALPFKPWRGESLEGKSLLIYAEQGVGDEMMFTSCIPDVIPLAEHCVIESNARLVSLFQRSFPSATVIGCDHEYIPRWLPTAPKIDFQIPMGSLPRLFRKSAGSFPQHHGYLRPDPIIVSKWQGRLANLAPGLRVAISWRGGTAKTRMFSRSISPELWAPILHTPDVQFISLQYGKCTEDVEILQEIAGPNRMHHWQEAIDDFEETAGLLMNIDLVITVCNTLTHLSGALGRPVWVLSPEVPEWRYLRNGSTIPWYPSSYIVRQTKAGDWQPVIQLLANKLGMYSQSQNPPEAA